jgi:toxin HigB-1
MIRSFAARATEDLFNGINSKESRAIPQDIHKVARRKLDYLNAAAVLEDLRVPPGNHLEALKNDLKGFHSIRINAQWRVIFRWDGGSAEQVRVCDYH